MSFVEMCFFFIDNSCFIRHSNYIFVEVYNNLRAGLRSSETKAHHVYLTHLLLIYLQIIQ